MNHSAPNFPPQDLLMDQAAVAAHQSVDGQFGQIAQAYEADQFDGIVHGAMPYTGNVYGAPRTLSAEEETMIVPAQEVGRIAGAAMLDAKSYVEPSLRGQLYGAIMADQIAA